MTEDFVVCNLPSPRELEKILKNGTVWVRIKVGKRTGTIAQVLEYAYYDSVKVKASGRHRFTIRMAHCEMLVGYTGGMVFVEDPNYIPPIFDFLNRPIKLGSSVAYCRSAGRSSSEMIVGIVKEITENGTVYVQPMKVGDSIISKDSYYRSTKDGLILATRERVLIIDEGTLDEMMLMKLVHG